MKSIRYLFIASIIMSMAGCATTDLQQEFKGQSDAQIFANGERALAKGKYDDAVKNFEGLDSLYPFGSYSEQGQLDIIYAYYKNDDPASALAAADRYIRLYPRSPSVDYAYYMKGLVNFGRDQTWLQKLWPTDPAERDLSYMREAFTDFNQLLELFPDSHYAPDAQQRMLYIRNILAKHEYEIANFYYVRKAYVAAVNRASIVVQSYQGSPQVISALAIMVKSYRALNEEQMASNTLQVLQLNYPYSKEAKALAKH